MDAMKDFQAASKAQPQLLAHVCKHLGQLESEQPTICMLADHPRSRKAVIRQHTRTPHLLEWHCHGLQCGL
jgi:hypothetical protein